MPDMGETFLGILGAAACIAAVVGGIKATLWLMDVLRKLSRFIDDVAGEPGRPGFPEGRPGLLERVATIEDRVESMPALEQRIAAIEAQLRPNGGGSLRDAVDRIAPPPPDQIAA